MKRKTLKRKVKRRMNNKNYKRKKKEKKITRKYVGGFGTPTSKFPCSILQTEFFHDLKGVLPPGPGRKNEVKRGDFNVNVVKNMAGECQLDQHDPQYITRTYEFDDDLTFLQSITTQTVDALKEYFTPRDVEINSRFLTRNASRNGYSQRHLTTTARVIFKHKPFNNEKNLFDLFGNLDPSSDNEWIDIFFVIDTGDNLVKILKGLTPPHGMKYRFHIIHSVYTLGDSAPKTLPNSSKYNCANSNIQLYSWLFTDNPVINPRDPIFMTSYRIKCTILQNWKVQQIWDYFQNGENKWQYKWQTDDSKLTNTNKKVIEEIKSRDNINDQENHLSIQKKRSGDYFQIRFAKKLPRYMNNRRNLDLQVFNAISSIKNQNDLYDLNYNLAEYKTRTFFLTGDWPAFSYALFNRMNSIIFAKHPSDPTKCGFLSASINP